MSRSFSLPLLAHVGHRHATAGDASHAHDHDHGHAHGHHGHSHGPASYDHAFAIGIGLNVTIVLVEAIFGLRAHSMALVADAGHNLSDVLGLLVAWGGTLLARRGPSARRTYGLRASSILAALANAVLLLVAIGAIAWEAVQRFAAPTAIDTGVVAWVAGVGILVNTATALLFMSGRKSDLNLRGAYMHMAADAAVSLGVLVGALAIRVTGWLWLDPAISLAIVAAIAIGTWGLLRDSVDLALGAVPAHIDPHAVDEYLRALPGVTEVHDLHIWGMSTTHVALTAHLVRPAHANDDALIADACAHLHERFGIEHVTLQIERGSDDHSCQLAPEHVV